MFRSEAAIDGEQVRYTGENNISEKKTLLPEWKKEDVARFSPK